MLAAFALAVQPVAAVAPNSTCGGLTPNFFAGYDNAAAGAAGAESTFETVNPLLCTGPDSGGQHGSSTWVAVTGPAGYSLSIYQVGTIKCVDPTNPNTCDGAFRTFTAWGRDHGAPGCAQTQLLSRAPVPVKEGNVPATSAKYTVVKSAATVQFKVNGTTVESIAASEICWIAAGPSYYGEVFDSGDQLGGTVGDTLRFTNALYEPSVGGAWSSPGFTAPCSTQDAPYNCRRLAGNSIEIWTDRS